MSLSSLGGRRGSTPLRIGLVGGGTVGGGVYEIIMGRLSGVAVVTKLCVRDATKRRDFAVSADKTTIVTDISDVYQDANVDVVVEVMGGTTVAKTLVQESLKRHKAVVTANKALLAEHLDELDQMVVDSNGKASLAYEAAVCGGIPIIHTLQTCFTGDVIYKLMAICNGTTNYMLGLMENEGAGYDHALKEAQALGYAEADPTADVEGHDARAKMALLTKLAFGKTLDPVTEIPCRGITAVGPVDFEYAKLLGCTIKLVGTAVRLSQNSEFDGPLSVYVTPQMVPTTHALAMAKTNGNGVVIQSANLGTTSYMGPGAGRFETANSVVADICRLASSPPSLPFPKADDPSLLVHGNYVSSFYVRIPFLESLGIIRTVGELAESNGISIYSVLQNQIVDRLQANVCVIVETCSVDQMEQFCNQLEQQEFCRQRPVYMPLLQNL